MFHTSKREYEKKRTESGGKPNKRISQNLKYKSRYRVAKQPSSDSKNIYKFYR